MRSAGIEYTSVEGESSASVIGTMSKHRSGKLEKSYLTELFKQATRVMAGMEKKDDIAIPRTLLDLPWSTESILSLIFSKRSM